MKPQPERAGPGQESVWDYPRPAIAEPTTARIVIEHRGQVVADTRSAVRTLETSHPPSFYIPRTDIARQPIFAWAGLWRISDEWGPVYSGVMTDCNEAIRPVHDRMPVLLMPDEYEQWLHSSFDDAVAFQSRCFPDDLIEMTRTSELWVKRKLPDAGATLV